MMRLSRVDSALDIGAYSGELVRASGQSGSRDGLLSVEPVGSSFDVLSRVAGSGSNWEVCQFALGRRAGAAEINVSDAAGFSSFLSLSSLGRTGSPASRACRQEKVEIHRLDDGSPSLVGDTKRIFLKLDSTASISRY